MIFTCQKIFEKFVPPDEKLLYQTIKELNDGNGATTNEIARALEQAIGKSPNLDELVRMLKHWQENGLVEINIVNLNEKAHLIWKP